MADHTPVSGRVVEVTLFEDRASVTRAFDVRAGRQTVVLGPLSPLVAEDRVSFPSGSAEIEDVRVRRERVTRVAADPAALAGLEAEVRAAEAAALAARQALGRAREREFRAHGAVETALAATGRVWVEDPDPDAWLTALRHLASACTAARRAVADADHRAQEADRTHAQRRADLDAARQGRPVWRAWLELRLWAEADGVAEVRYVVPCAVWRPLHTAALDTAARNVQVTLRAMCWNATGEDWTQVALVCSTARPGALGAPPPLGEDVVQARRRATELVVETREEAVQVARAVGGRRAAELPGVDDGGEPRTWRAPHPVDLPSTGRPTSVALDAFGADTDVRWVATPELGPAVIARCLARNTGARPMLAGPVELFRDGAYVGRSRVDLVPPGETFPLGMGAHDGVRVTRRVDQKVETALVTGRQTRTFTVELRVMHLGDAAVRVAVDERVPVSELKEVTVSPPRAEPALDGPVDRDGFVRWTLELFPGDVRTLTLSYAVDAASHVHLPF